MTPARSAAAPRPLSRRTRRTAPALGPQALAAGLLLAAVPGALA